MKLKHKFLIIFIVISIIPVIIVSVLTYMRYTELVNDEMSNISNNIIQNVSKNTSDAINRVDVITESFETYFQGSYTVLDDLKKYRNKNSGYTSYDLYETRNNMGFICRQILYQNSYVNGIYIFTPSGENIGYGNVDVKLGYTPFQDKWYKDTVAMRGDIFISDLSAKNFFIYPRPSITFSRALYDVYTKEFLGVLVIDCSPEIFSFTENDNLSNVSSISIQKDNGSTLYKSQIMQSKSSETLKKHLVQYPITIYVTLDKAKLYSNFGFTKMLVITIVFIFALILLIISFYLSKNLTHPITALSEIMRKHDTRILAESQKYLNRNDEIGCLYNEYNNMIEEINTYIKDQYQNKLITLDAQMKALEAQINSHFLYNTLETINSLAEIEGIDSISSMSLALGSMFRYSIKTESELVTIQSECEHMENYITIQKIRFDGNFQFFNRIDSSLRNFKVLKLILQPVVENSFKHGIEQSSEKGTITVDAYLKENNVFIIVSDDGAGIPTDKLKEIREKLADNPEFKDLGRRNRQSIGIKNINSRIQLYYGKTYGISIYSEEHKGTTVVIKLPAIEGGFQNCTPTL